MKIIKTEIAILRTFVDRLAVSLVLLYNGHLSFNFNPFCVCYLAHEIPHTQNQAEHAVDGRSDPPI